MSTSVPPRIPVGGRARGRTAGWATSRPAGGPVPRSVRYRSISPSSCASTEASRRSGPGAAPPGAGPSRMRPGSATRQLRGEAQAQLVDEPRPPRTSRTGPARPRTAPGSSPRPRARPAPPPGRHVLADREDLRGVAEPGPRPGAGRGAVVSSSGGTAVSVNSGASGASSRGRRHDRDRRHLRLPPGPAAGPQLGRGARPPVVLGAHRARPGDDHVGELAQQPEHLPVAGRGQPRRKTAAATLTAPSALATKFTRTNGRRRCVGIGVDPGERRPVELARRPARGPDVPHHSALACSSSIARDASDLFSPVGGSTPACCARVSR